MSPLQTLVAYWRDCIKAESALEQSFGIEMSKFVLQPRTRALLFPGSHDPFIFAENDFTYTLEKGKAYETIAKAKLKGQDIYFGYPLLMFYDKGTKRNHVAPLFSMRLEVQFGDNNLKLVRAESSPTLGSCAFEKLGLHQEEIAALNTDVEEIFKGGAPTKLGTILYLLKKATNLTLIESIDPASLSTNATVHPYDGTVVYNKAVLSVGEASAYNVHVLHDLDTLVKRDDLQDSSLKYIDTPTQKSQNTCVPVLPFAFDEYQIQAIDHIMGSEHTVVTGPPGTGKSQFIANLIINLFLQKKRVLFVSHTSEAVRVVNERINDAFTNLMMQTGKKELRQELGMRLEELVAHYNEERTAPNREHSFEDITRNWQELQADTKYLQQSSKLHKKLEDSLRISTASHVHPIPLRKLRGQAARIRAMWFLMRLRNRRTDHDVLTAIKQRKDQHVVISRSYVNTNYLKLIFENSSYGQLVAYVDAVQNKKFTYGHTQDKSEKYIHAALQAMNVWSCTLKSLAATFPLQVNLFDYVIFDEASQIDLPSAAPALYRAKRLVVVGDENQLNHIAKIHDRTEQELAATYNLEGAPFYPALTRYTDTSLFNSARKALNEPEHELKNHYRSNAQIAGLFSSIFYGGKLKVHEPVANLPADITPGVHWIDIAGTAYKHKSGSKYNMEEAAHIVGLLKKLIPVAKERGLTIGVTTPFTKQRDLIADKAMGIFSPEDLACVQILTVHKFQGSEVDMLIFSPVLTAKGEDSSDYWFIKNKQILNVAISRAKQLLLITGDLGFALQSESKLKDIAEHCEHLRGDDKKMTPHRPMNMYEKRLFTLLQDSVPKRYTLEPQYVIDGRYTVDFAMYSNQKHVAIELDGRQHEIIGGLPVFEDVQRDAYLAGKGWAIIRIPVYELLKEPDHVRKTIADALKKNPISYTSL